MQDKPLWGLYTLEKDTQGNIHKRPFSPTGYPASISKLNQWSSPDNVLEALANCTVAGAAGIGILLPAPYVLLDKDATPDAPIYDNTTRKIVSAMTLRLLAQVPTYAELSPNKGLHIITEGRPKRAISKHQSLRCILIGLAP